MYRRIRVSCAPLLFVMFGILATALGANAQDADQTLWRVSKSSGDVWVSTSGVQQASLTNTAILKPGDSIRTGRNGRVLLVRGEETILVSPNSVIGLPQESEEKSTTIIQQAGSILLEVEKRNVKHFEVETPYLVAAVKGTQFRVSVNRDDAKVEVVRGEVEVADVKSGRYALVLPGQSATVSPRLGGLSLNGSGSLSPIQQGEPRRSSPRPVPVPKAGLTAPRNLPAGQHVRALGNPSRSAGANRALRIAAPLGEVKLNVQKATNGLARAAVTSASPAGRAAAETVWKVGELSPNGSGSGQGNAKGNSNGNGNGNANGNGNGNGNSNGNGNGYGNGNGNGNGYGNGNGNGPGASVGAALGGSGGVSVGAAVGGSTGLSVSVGVGTALSVSASAGGGNPLGLNVGVGLLGKLSKGKGKH